MATDPSPREIAEHDAYLRSVQIVSVRFARASVHAPHIYIPDPARQLRSETRRGARHLNFPTGFIATVNFHFRGFWEDQPEVGVTAEAEVEVLYRAPAPIPDDLFKLFQHRTLAPHTWPYLREFLHTSLARTGWPVQTLPIYRAAVTGSVPPGSASGGLVE